MRAACDGVDHVLHLAYKVSVGGGAALAGRDATGERRRHGRAAAICRRRRGPACRGRRQRPRRRRQSRTCAARRARQLVPACLRIFPTRRSAGTRRSPRWPRRGRASTSSASAPRSRSGRTTRSARRRTSCSSGWSPASCRCRCRVAFSCTDVRDFADGMVRAAERGRSGERYLLTGENVTADAAAATSRRDRRRSRAAVEAADVPRARGDRSAGTRQPAARTAGAGHTRRAAGRSGATRGTTQPRHEPSSAGRNGRWTRRSPTPSSGCASAATDGPGARSPGGDERPRNPGRRPDRCPL